MNIICAYFIFSSSADCKDATFHLLSLRITHISVSYQLLSGYTGSVTLLLSITWLDGSPSMTTTLTSSLKLLFEASLFGLLFHLSSKRFSCSLFPMNHG
jgi:hypothetical protein